jgi:HAD superfamily hydrolase (TIGR01509 family)
MNARPDLDRFPVLLLDLNSTFMFGGDRFGPGHDYAATHAALGGRLPAPAVRSIIQACYDRLLALYPDPRYHDAFPTVRASLAACAEAHGVDEAELRLLEQTFAHHELGRVPEAYAEAVNALARRHRLGLVADLWSTPAPWRAELARAGVRAAFEVLVFSSDHGCVKPSPRLFQVALDRMGARPEACLVIGDSARRDVGGARAAGIAALWIGEGDPPPGARWAVPDLCALTRGRAPLQDLPLQDIPVRGLPPTA